MSSYNFQPRILRRERGYGFLPPLNGENPLDIRQTNQEQRRHSPDEAASKGSVCMASVHIHDVRKSFGGFEVLHGVTIPIEDGAFVVLVGPSGCGKSTLLRMLAGLENITSGTISIGDRVVNDVQPKERDIAMVFQNYALYPHMTVAQNMGFSLKLRGVGQDEINQLVSRAADILGLAPLLERFPRQLSGGQRQRVAMGRAIVRNPQVFLFDEPLSNLDAKLRVAMRTEIKELHQRLRTTTVYVTHDQIEAMTMADKIVVMHDGIVEQMGSPLELYDHPDNKFVAGFIGSPAMNFLDGKLTGGDRPCVETADGSRLPLAASRTGLEGKPVVYGIRPEHLEFADDGVEAEVAVVEPTGSETQIVARIGTQDIIAVIRDRRPVKPGDKIRLRPVASSAHVFDKDTGKRLIN
jgi:multiple sugar transport system ATP-binding protein